MKIINPKTRKLLLQVKRQILKEPLQFEMHSWFYSNPSIPNCGTAACIGGWAISLSEKVGPKEAYQLSHRSPWTTRDLACKSLNLTVYELAPLFFLDKWPAVFKNGFKRAGKKGRTQIAAKRIDHFLATGE